ncbi:hypothetical protein AB1Y20_000739 [Prymnesium parvum]|uniref:Uncharacterized protein n=1 Tax=Prymnesium parvum TaxID=97485 RepID=A0AB34K8W1_PRYPA
MEGAVLDAPAEEGAMVGAVAEEMMDAVAAPETTVTAEAVATVADLGPSKKKRASGVPVPRWTPEEEERLKLAVHELGEKSWTLVAERLGNGRSATGIDQHWAIMMGKRKRPSKKDGEEEAGSPMTSSIATATIQAEVMPADGVNGIATELNANSVEKRRRHGGSTSRWTPEEEAKLKELVSQFGVRAWTQVTDGLGTSRTPSGVEQHWQVMNGKRKRKDRGSGVQATAITAIATNPDGTEIMPTAYTAPDGTVVPMVPTLANPDGPKAKRHRTPGGKTQRWSPEEEEKLKALVAEYSSSGHWPTIAEKLETGRTTAGVEQHWQILTGRRKRNTPNKGGMANGMHTAASVVVEATADEYAQQPQYMDAQVAYVDAQPEYAEQQAEYAEQQPEYAEQQPEYAEQQPEYAEEQPEYAEEQPEYAEEQQEYAEQQVGYD